MGRQPGKNLLLKIEDSEGAGTFTTLGMLQTTSYTLTANDEDVTNFDSGDWEERDVTNLGLAASGRGFFDDGTAWARLRAAILAKEKPKLQVVDPGEGTYEGRFVVNLEKTGNQTGSVEASTSIRSASVIAFTPS